MNNLEPKDLKQGMVFGRLTLIRREKESSSLNWVVQCSCEKKTIKVVRASNILRGATKGCGCLQIEGLKIGMEKAKHGNSRRSKKTKEYKVWEGMKKRCLTDNPKYAIYKNIEVCDRWKSSFQNFLDDMGAIPSNDHSIDRIDNSKGYIEGNVQWVHKLANLMKNKFTDEEYIEMCEKVAAYQATLKQGKGV